MKKADSTLLLGLLLLTASAVGCSGDADEPDGEMLATSAGSDFVLYGSPFAADPALPNPIGSTARASATAWDVDDKLRLSLTVRGMPPNRDFGSHLHKLPCEDPTKAGGHYQHMAFTTMASDPVFANATNEAWLDFTTDVDGEASVEVTVDWLPRPSEAKSIIIHNLKTAVGGIAGDKLACLGLGLP